MAKKNWQKKSIHLLSITGRKARAQYQTSISLLTVFFIVIIKSISIHFNPFQSISSALRAGRAEPSIKHPSAKIKKMTKIKKMAKKTGKKNQSISSALRAGRAEPSIKHPSAKIKKMTKIKKNGKKTGKK